REACAFRDDTDAFREAGAVVLGVSVQGESSHREFREKYRLSFDLVADPDRQITAAFRAVAIHGLAKRVTYVIGPDGRILAAYRRLDPKSHSREDLRVLAGSRKRLPALPQSFPMSRSRGTFAFGTSAFLNTSWAMRTWAPSGGCS